MDGLRNQNEKKNRELKWLNWCVRQNILEILWLLDETVDAGPDLKEAGGAAGTSQESGFR